MSEEKPLLGMNLLLAVPTYGPPDELCQKDLRRGMMFASRLGVSWEGDASPSRMGWADARNSVAQVLMEVPERVNGIMWVDSDIRHKASDIGSLLASAREFNKEFVSGVYHQRISPHKPVLYHYDRAISKFRNTDEFPENVFAPTDGCGFGFVYTSRKLVETIALSPGFDPAKGWFPDERTSGGFGEDLSFCWHAMQVGIGLYVNTAIQVGHTGEPNVIYREDHLREKAKQQVEIRGEEVKQQWGIKR